MKEKQPYSLKKRITIAFAIILLAIAIVVRLYFSIWLLQYVNDVLAHIKGYEGSVESINVDLYRGAYRINKLVLNKATGKIPTPFISIDVVDFSVQWGSLLHGRIVSTATLTRPVINFAVKESAEQTGQNVDWTKPIKDLMPVDINYVNLKDGSITYQDFSSTPNVNIFIHHLYGQALNLRNVKDANNPMPSTLDIRGDSIGNGQLKLYGQMNILKEVPDMNLLLSLDNVDLPAINNYSEAYGAFDFKSGDFSLYSQLIVKNNRVSGYVKPLVRHLSVNIVKNANPLEITWRAIVAGVLAIFSNLSEDQFATRADLEGSFDDINTDTWSALGGILRNAFISAMAKGFDQTGKKDLIPPKPAENK